MEEGILEILDKESYNLYMGFEGKTRATKEIATHITKFIEWMFEKECFYGELSNKYLSAVTSELKFDSLEEVYQHWKDNIKEK